MIKVFIAGDYCPQHRIAKMVAEADYGFFDEVTAYTREADYSIVNLECAVVEGEAQPIRKCGPALRTNANAVSALRYAGFSCAALANNHFRDFGDDGCRTTINTLTANNIDFVGGGNNINEAQQVLYTNINGTKLAIVNICENEFSVATHSRAGSAPIDPIDNYNQIQEARKNADYVIVIVHGGHEMYQLPSPRMKKLYRHYITIGADAVVNHHQHCFSGYEIFNNHPIVYGIGNFCFDEEGTKGIWNYGYCVQIIFTNGKIDLELLPYKQCDEEPNIHFLNGNELTAFHKQIDQLNSAIGNDITLSESFAQWSESRARTYDNIFNSYHNRYLNAAANRNIIKHPASKAEINAMFDYINCESHRDIVLYLLNKQINNE